MKTLCIPCRLIWPARIFLALCLAIVFATGCDFGDEDVDPGPDAGAVDWDALSTEPFPIRCFPGPCPDAGPPDAGQ